MKSVKGILLGLLMALALSVGSNSVAADVEIVEIDCNAPETIFAPDAPISFTATATNTDDVVITGFDCLRVTKKGKDVDKKESCVVAIDPSDTITILDSGGVGNQITWTVEATDAAGNVINIEEPCQVEVVKKK